MTGSPGWMPSAATSRRSLTALTWSLRAVTKSHSACLKKSYRDVFRLKFETLFVYLKVEEEVVRMRLDGRKGHFAHASILKSQISTLEVPNDECDVIVVDSSQDARAMVDMAVGAL
jgi:carbohydrate kinase (thermoresistant glucokinase family)